MRKRRFTKKQEEQKKAIERSYVKRGKSIKVARRIAFATVNARKKKK